MYVTYIILVKYSCIDTYQFFEYVSFLALLGRAKRELKNSLHARTGPQPLHKPASSIHNPNNI